MIVCSVSVETVSDTALKAWGNPTERKKAKNFVLNELPILRRFCLENDNDNDCPIYGWYKRVISSESEEVTGENPDFS